jgi:uncharacterized membrane protein YfcA
MFLDALGIGCYAPTTACFKFRGTPPDELIPGTLNVGHNLASSIEAVAVISVVAVAPSLLVGMIGSATLGAWLGAGMVSRLSRASIQAWMGAALLIAAVFFALANLGALPAGGTAIGLEGWRYAVAVGASFVCGALMTVGIGAYAPMMAMLGLLGMHPLGAFPIMMGSCALLQPVACLRFFQSGRFAFGTSLGLTLGGVVGVLIALYIVKSLPLHLLRWLVLIVVTYAAFTMLRSWRRERR